MSEFLKNISDKELVNLAAFAENSHLEAAESIIVDEFNKRHLGNVALSYGVYDASQDEYNVNEHPEDDRWIIRGED